MKKSKLKNTVAQKQAHMAKVVAKQNIKPVLKHWVTEVFEPNPVKKDYEDALSFVEDIIKTAQKEPTYLKLLSNLALLIDKSKFADKLLPYIFRTVTHPRGKIGKLNSLEFDHKLIMEELQEAAKELRQ